MKKRSITRRSIWTTVITCVVLGFIALVIGLTSYGASLVDQYVSHAFETASHAAVSARHGGDPKTLTDQVMGIYRSQTPAERAKTGTAEYRSRFAAVDTTPGSAWDDLVHILGNFAINVDDVYLGMYDKEACALVIIADPPGEGSMAPGDWQSVSPREMQTFLDWDGEGMLYVIDSVVGSSEWMCTAGCPLRTEDGEVYAFVLVDVTLENLMGYLLDYTLKMALGILIVTLITAWISSKHIKREITDPIDRIAGAAMEYIRGKKEGIEGDYFSGLDIHTGDELENLSNVLQDMEKSLAEHEESIRAITAKQERNNTEMDLAARIQAAMLPHTFPPFPDRKEFDLYASMDPAREVGGDFYDFFLIDPDHLCLVIADVSGKGVPGALFMMISTTILRSCAMLGNGAGRILDKTNEALCSNNQAEMFVTVWVGILEISTGRMTCANAGHEYPAIYRAERGTFELLKDKHGPVIGALDGVKYIEYELQFQKGDKLFVYTDGVPEATDTNERMYGTGGMLETLNADPHAGPEGLLENVKAAADAFVGDAEQFDDMTMLCMKYNGPETASGAEEA